MTLDVVVVTFQSAPHLRTCLGALPTDARVTVVDNASTDGSADLAARLGAKVIRNSDNRGFAAAANQGARLGEGEAILFLNPDASVDAENLSLLLAALDDTPTIAAVAPRLLRPDGTEQRTWWPFPSPKNTWSEAIGLHRLRPPHPGPDGTVPFAVGACLLVRRSTFEWLDGFDERFWLYGEEADLCRRAWDGGWQVRFVPTAIARHVGGASGSAAPGETFEHFQRGSEHFIAKHHGSTALVLHRLGLLLASVLRLLALSLRPGGTRHGAWQIRKAMSVRLLSLLARHPARLPGGDVSGPLTGLVVCSLEAWDDVWRRNQFFVDGLLRRNTQLRVLFVEPPHDLVLGLANGLLPRKPRIRPVGDTGRLWAFRPLKLLPRRLGPWSDLALRAQVRWASSRIGLSDPLLWLNDSTYSPMIAHRNWRCLYDITDDWLLFSNTPREQRRLEHLEEIALRDASTVVVCSAGLARSRGLVRPVELIPNGVDVHHFRRPQPRPVDLPASPVAVYVGTLHDQRIDVELLMRLSKDHVGLQIALVGPDSLSNGSRSWIDALENVTRLGARSYRDVPAYLQHADVIVIPHRVTPFTESLDPIKAYECLAVDTPTVATEVAGFRGLGGNVVTVSDADFSAAVANALRKGDRPSPSDAPSGITWEARVRDFEAALTRTSSANTGKHEATDNEPGAGCRRKPTRNMRRRSSL